MKITKGQLMQIIKEELHKKRSINEAKLSKTETKIGELYGWAGIKTKYSDDIVNQYGKEVVDAAVKMAPKVLSYQKKLKSIVKEIENSTEANILMVMITKQRGFEGDSRSAKLTDLLDM